MKKHEDNPDMKVLKTAACPTLSGKSTLTYQIGISPDSVVHLRISKNTGAGFFSDEWLSIDSIVETLKKRPEGLPVLSHYLTPLLKGKSVNTSAFILAALSHLKLIRPLPKKKRQHELLDPMPFLEEVTQMMDGEKPTAKKTAVRKAPVRKTASKKAAIKKKAISRRKA
jgi:hypothetical protein